MYYDKHLTERQWQAVFFAIGRYGHRKNTSLKSPPQALHIFEYFLDSQH